MQKLSVWRTEAVLKSHIDQDPVGAPRNQKIKPQVDSVMVLISSYRDSFPFFIDVIDEHE